MHSGNVTHMCGLLDGAVGFTVALFASVAALILPNLAQAFMDMQSHAVA